jgi:predicted protein tyrosine phosphatase
MIDIKSLVKARRVKRRYDAVLSVEDPGSRRGLRFHRRPHPDHLVLRLEDIDHQEVFLAGPDIHHVERAIAFAREHMNGKLLIHCHVGVCRSTALGLAIIADRLGEGSEDRAVQTLLASNPDAVPNLLMLDMADAVLERKGRLVSAWHSAETGSVPLATYRKKKAKLLTEKRHLFSPRPASGYHLAGRCRPESLTLTLG